MVCVTRFNPSCNGPLHLGHIYTLTINERYAHERSGAFYVRWDDLPFEDMRRESDLDMIARIRDGMREDIEWLGFKVDGWYSELEMMPQVETVWRHYHYEPAPYLSRPIHPAYVHQPKGWLSYPYQPLLSAERAVFDGLMGCTHLIRGEELATDLSLHCHYCDLFHIAKPEFIFLPRLMSAAGDISKTNGGYTIAGLRGAGYTPDAVHDLLARASLIAPFNGWDLGNLKPQPRVTL